MFYDNYLDEFYLKELYQNYDINFLKNVDETNFKNVYQIFKKYNVYYIEDIILEYLDIFMLDCHVVEDKLLNLKKLLGDNFIEQIGDDLSYLEYIVR